MANLNIPISRRHAEGHSAIQTLLTVDKEWGYDETNEEFCVRVTGGSYLYHGRSKLFEPGSNTEVVTVSSGIVSFNGVAGIYGFDTSSGSLEEGKLTLRVKYSNTFYDVIDIHGDYFRFKTPLLDVGLDGVTGINKIFGYNATGYAGGVSYTASDGEILLRTDETEITGSILSQTDSSNILCSGNFNTLDGYVHTEFTSAASYGYVTDVDTDTHYRFAINAVGKHEWGSGTATRDLYVYRGSDSSLVVERPTGGDSGTFDVLIIKVSDTISNDIYPAIVFVGDDSTYPSNTFGRISAGPNIIEIKPTDAASGPITCAVIGDGLQDTEFVVNTAESSGTTYDCGISIRTGGTDRLRTWWDAANSTARITGDVTFDGHITLADTVWKDINFNPIGARGGVSDPDLVAYTTGGATVYYAAFSPTTAEEINAHAELQHDAKEGADITPHIHWAPTTTNTGNVKWNLDYIIVDSGVAVVAAGTLTITVAASGTQYDWDRDSFSAISGTNLTIGNQVGFRLYRDATNGADTYADDVIVSTFGFHYEIDSIGSDGMTTK